MTLPLAIGALVLGFAFLVLGGDALVRSAISLAVRTSIPPAVISLTIIAAGTSAPELFTSILAAVQNSPDIAAGNVFGSNIFNVLAILGISFLLHPPIPKKQFMGLEWSMLLLATVATYILGKNLELSRFEGGLFVVMLVVMLSYSVIRAKKQGFDPQDSDEPIETLKNVYFDLGYLALGCALLIGGANLALEGGVFLGKLAGLSEKIIGITIISVGTGLPELATSAVAAFRGRSDIAIGNVLGSNLMNTLAVLGSTALVAPLSISESLIRIDIWIFLLTTLLLFPIIKGVRFSLSRFSGALLLALYVAYVIACLQDWKFLAGAI